MAYVTPPTFTAGSVLSAAQLNTLGDDVAFLQGIIDAPNAAVVSQTLIASGSIVYAYRHTHDGLVFEYANTNGGASSNMFIQIYDDNNDWRTIYSDGTLDNETVTEYWSLTAQDAVDQRKNKGDGTAYLGVASTVDLTVGNHYEVAVQYTQNGATSFTFKYLYNTTGTAI